MGGKRAVRVPGALTRDGNYYIRREKMILCAFTHFLHQTTAAPGLDYRRPCAGRL
jgi:hypothetical protein